MKTLNLDMISTIEISTEYGFAWAVDSNDNNLFQVCCDANGSIDKNDCGHDWGVCGDYNNSLNYDDLETAKDIFFDFFKLRSEKIQNNGVIPHVENSTIELSAYKNTTSSAGSPTRLSINVNEVIAVNRWVNYYGNPSYVFHMNNGDTYFTVDDYSFCHSWFTDIHIKSVNRKKDMFNRFA